METKKMSWENPAVDVQRFVPQYCQTPCGDGEEMVTYYFECDAGLNENHYVFLETNGEEGLQPNGRFEWGDYWWEVEYHNPDQRLTRTFHPCSQTHVVTVPRSQSIDDIFPMGYMLERNQTIPVRIWTANGTNVHCTTQLREDSFVPHSPS